jgi:Ca-activated chloride channel family protein
MRAFLITLFTLVFLPFAGLAQSDDRPNTILVLDASGSMWGQIDGENKIVIARNVIAEMLAEIPDDAALGLTVYGHRERGSCTDIETIVAPAPGTQDAILEAVNAINPRGRTPMSDAVVAAARSLRHTENAATVILVSDGIENCNPDPCAIAAELEATGVGFTAHVVGFDVASEPEARAQMQCIAENTGGLFLTADNADELAEALETVVAAAPPPPTLMRLEAQLDPSGEMVTRPVTWTIIGEANTVIAEGLTGAFVDFAFDAGLYTIEATRQEPDGPVTYSINTIVEQDRSDLIIVRMPEIIETYEVTLTARIGAADGPLIEDPVFWTVTPEIGELAGTANPGIVALEDGAYSVNAFWTAEEIEETIAFDISGAGREIVVIFPEPQEQATLSAPATAVAGTEIAVTWTGPNLDGDYIGVGLAGETGPDLWANFAYTRDGDPATLLMPMTTGTHAITYFLGDGRDAIGETSIEITPPEVTLSAPVEATAGESIAVTWTGPDYEGDYIGIGQVGASGPDQWENFVYTREGSPATLLLPGTEGNYLITYFAAQDRTPLAQVPITLKATSASITAPQTAVAGAMIELSWTGPDAEGDYIGIGLVGTSGPDQWENFVYTRDGSPVMLQIPPRAGDYTITYFLGQDRMPLTSVPISVTDVTAGITAPAAATAGETIQITWTGPGYDGDYIGIGQVGANGPDQWQNFVYTREGSPTNLLIPPAAGDYMIRYFIGQDRQEIASVPISVAPVTASVMTPGEAAAGSTLTLEWTGPNYDGDYIGIGAVGATGPDQWESYVYTRDGSPTTLSLPEAPGAYVIRYFLAQSRTEIASTSITLK